MQRHTTFFLALLLCMFQFTTPILAQPYTLQHLGVANGLSNNYVRDIAQDKQGCIWIATELGLNRFDGNSFTTYKSNNSGLSSDALNVLLYDKTENVLWIGGKFKGICTLDCSTYQFKHHDMQEGADINNVVHLSHAADGGIWITTHHGSIIHYNKQT